MKRMNRVSHVLLEFVVGVLVFLSAGRHVSAQAPVLISGDPDLKHPIQLATDGTSIFVTGGGSDNLGHIFRVPIGGGPATRVYTIGDQYQIAVVGSNLYWIDPNGGPIGDTRIFSAPKTGGGPITAIYTGQLVGQPIVDGSGITTDGLKLYTADEVNGRVHSLNTSGSGLTQLGPERYGGGFANEHLNTIATAGGLLYVADSGKSGVSGPGIYTISTAGGASFATLFAGAPFVQPTGIAIGDGMIFVSDASAGNTIWEMPVSGGTPTALVSGGPFVNLAGLAFYNHALYVADNGNGVSGGAIYMVSVPEPATLTLVGWGALCLWVYRRRNRLQ
jgi:DNA-binding beta-propeller fold protein YncE